MRKKYIFKKHRYFLNNIHAKTVPPNTLNSASTVKNAKEKLHPVLTNPIIPTEQAINTFCIKPITDNNVALN